MGKFRLHSIKIKRAINNTKYVVAKKQNLDCPWEEETDYICFSDNAVRLYEPYLAFANGGKSDVDKQIPEQCLIIDGGYYDYKFEHFFFRKYIKNDLKNGARKGDYIRNTDGKVVIFDTLRIFCQYYLDKCGNINFLAKQSPKEVGMREYRYCCIPYSKDLEEQLNGVCISHYSGDDYYQTDNYDDRDSIYYDDNLDMDQQSQEYWEDLGIF